MSRRYITEIGLKRRRYRFISYAVITMLVFCSLAVLVCLFFLYFPLFRVRDIKVEGITYIPEDKVMSLLSSRVMNDSAVSHFLGIRNMLIWPEAMTTEDLKFLPEASSVSIDKDYFRGTVTVKVTEREHQGIWCFRNAMPATCYWFDDQGLITRTPATEGSLILVLNDYSRAGIESGGPLLAPAEVTNLFSIFTALKSMPVNPQEIRLEDLALEEIKVPTFDGPTLLFSLRFPAVNTPAAMDVLRQKTSLKKLSEIDFRIENRIYYK